MSLDGPVSHRKTVLYVNHFVVEMTSFLNNFAAVCEEKLTACAHSAARVETTLSKKFNE
jgi:hypothetical protein